VLLRGRRVPPGPNLEAAVHPIRIRRGLTLIELIVVLAVLVILAGLILPKLDGVLGKAHSANGAATIGEVAKYMETYRALHGGFYPDMYDSMLGNAAAGTVYSKLLPLAKIRYLPAQLTALELQSFQRVGINRVVTQDEASTGLPGDADMNPDGTVFQTVTLAAGTWLLKLDRTNPDNLATLAEFHADLTDPNRNFYVFGIGPACTIIGEGGVTLDAPLHQDNDPGTFYNRFVVIFAPDPAGDDRAKLIGTLGPDGDSMRKHINEFYKN
jgi:prepilin-type N-terminal cleavage/methylation domain-containing protein